ncbi:MAG: 4Fe-4S dicluster domain-containing protein [Desulfobacula sp.]|jgi:formate dehydrogenase iron-sulfur subunit|uniref:4Fe-4S dicluster domain-containing protein n=1 Tax=Desulfobacula sp. TaxID=2593537 RepID=UPI001E134C36|nr:4Fe-4S dicluster domain-containing protein [Desulfobacula sp.]MBT3484753.1 4Fe-4S dicluster domain-containing protein [Desulfobacula sp.]MBT3804383.1 4Fe-4S dicluster domain-containing protein [Desulfobacula sp.]MBT4025174.1 4Fe-4S dicluster domain-containing protein [Desulfobacula sp.]MBT4198576.1 4Fe-4S dicluster domain-containing protein [Desulfobacula sp.]
MTSKISRRAFLKGSITAVGSVAATTSVARAAKSITKGKNEPLVTLLDISKCIGCEECVFACQEANAAKYPEPEKPFPKMYPPRVPVEDWSDKRDVTDRLTPYNWLFIQRASAIVNGEEIELTIPRRCMHCDNPPCVKLCPWGALKQEENGLSRIDSNICLGGSKCRKACPWKVPQRQTGVGLYLDLLPALAGNGAMYKCDRCYNKLEKGEVPACIEVCPEDVQTIGPRKEILKKAHALAKDMNGYIYGEHENGGTNTIYVSPIPFEQLNERIEKGKGKPHLNKVKNMMADGTNLAKAMIVAPIAGLAAAFGKFYLSSKEDKS